MDYNRVPACSLAKLVHKNITIDQVTEHTFGEGGIRLKYVHSLQVYKTIDHDHHYLYYFSLSPIFLQNITLESSEGCKYDSIVVSDTKNVSLDRSARICGVFNKQEANRYHPR